MDENINYIKSINLREIKVELIEIFVILKVLLIKYFSNITPNKNYFMSNEHALNSIK